jgi:hypothetical protein
VQIGVYVGETSDQPPKPAGRPAIRCAPRAYITQAELYARHSLRLQE